MQSGVLGELGVKGEAQHGALSNAYDPPLAGGNRLHSRPEFFHPRRSDEDSREDTDAFLPGQAKLHGGPKAMRPASKRRCGVRLCPMRQVAAAPLRPCRWRASATPRLAALPLLA